MSSGSARSIFTAGTSSHRGAAASPNVDDDDEESDDEGEADEDHQPAVIREPDEGE